MPNFEVRLVNGQGKTIGYSDRWYAHLVRKGPRGLILGQKHVGITIACVDEEGRVLVARRRHRIFDGVWTLSGDTHPYRMYGRMDTEDITQAATRCAAGELGAGIKGWRRRLTLSYSARDPRNPRYCENELLHVMVRKCADHPSLSVDPKSAYETKWVKPSEILEDCGQDLKKEPINRKYAPWVHAMFAALPSENIGAAFFLGPPASQFQLPSTRLTGGGAFFTWESSPVLTPSDIPPSCSLAPP